MSKIKYLTKQHFSCDKTRSQRAQQEYIDKTNIPPKDLPRVRSVDTNISFSSKKREMDCSQLHKFDNTSGRT